jgi:hypothetical protein
MLTTVSVAREAPLSSDETDLVPLADLAVSAASIYRMRSMACPIGQKPALLTYAPTSGGMTASTNTQAASILPKVLTPPSDFAAQ